MKVILNDKHFHVFDQEVAQRRYLVSAKCKEKAKYRVSCACGEAGTEVFKYGKKTATSAASLRIKAGHDMVLAWDEASHWSVCSACGTKTEPEAHCGGTATETEPAKCEVCGQRYGELKTGAAGRRYLLN